MTLIDLDQIKKDKEIIDNFIRSLSRGRLKYILKSDEAYFKAIDFLEDHDEEILDVVLKHRFYFEYKVNNI